MRRTFFSLLFLALAFPQPSRALVDLDNDGWSDLWEAQYGHGYAKDADDDGDGFTNWQEHNDGTDPRDAGSKHPDPTWEKLPLGKHRFTWPHRAGQDVPAGRLPSMAAPPGSGSARRSSAPAPPWRRRSPR